MNFYCLVLVAVLTLTAVEESYSFMDVYGGGITWYCMTWGIGCPEDKPCVPILMQKDTGSGIVISGDDVPVDYAEELCSKWGIGCCRPGTNDTPDLKVIGTPCDMLARAANTLYVYSPHTAKVILKEIHKLEDHVGFKFSNKRKLKKLACAVAEAKNLKELGKALHVSVQELKRGQYRLQRTAKNNCRKFTIGMNSLLNVDSKNTFTRQATYAMTLFCQLLKKYRIFSMRS